MEPWQMDIVGGVRLADGTEAKIVTGVDDYSRFCVSAFVVARTTARPTCDALALAMRTRGVPHHILTGYDGPPCLQAEPHTHLLPCARHLGEADRQYVSRIIRAG